MKKCEYCAKEISYHEQYCCDNCHKLARKFYNSLEYKRTLFSIINVIGILGLVVGLIWALFQNHIGSIIVGSSAIILGMLYFFLPFATPEMIRKNKIMKAIKIVKIMGIVGISIGVLLLSWGLFLLFNI